MSIFATRPRSLARRRGAASVEFAIVGMVFLTFLFGMLELARLLYVHNTLQEVTRRAAREMTVRWITEVDTVREIAMFGAATLPGGPEVTAENIRIEFLAADGSLVTTFPEDPSDNLSACGDAARTASCIYAVRVSIDGDAPLMYTPMLSIFSMFGSIELPSSSVTMHAESMGFET